MDSWEHSEVFGKDVPEPTFCMLRKYAPPEPEPTASITDSVLHIINTIDHIFECLLIHQESTHGLPAPYPFIVMINKVTRKAAGILVKLLQALIETSPEKQKGSLLYTIGSWHRTPSDAGADDLLIELRLCGIFELST